MFTALSDPAGVIAHRPGALERVQLLAEDWQLTKDRLAETEQRMTAVLGELGLTALATSITGLSPAGAAAILAETGDPGRFATARAVARHAGLAPREKLSGAFTGRTRADRARTPRAPPGSLARRLGSPARQPRIPGPLPAPDQQGPEQAHARPGPGHHRRRDLAAAARGHHHRAGMGSSHRGPRHPAAKQATRRLTLSAALQAGGRGEPSAALRHTVISAHIMGSPVRRLSTRSRAAGTNPIPLCRDRRRTRHRPKA